MIEGLKIDVSSQELTQLLAEREQHHRQRVDLYKNKVHALEGAGVEEMQASNDPLGGLRSKIDEHQRKAVFFAFLREHVVPKETYRLSENDLVRLEIISRYF